VTLHIPEWVGPSIGAVATLYAIIRWHLLKRPIKAEVVEDKVGATSTAIVQAAHDRLAVSGADAAWDKHSKKLSLRRGKFAVRLNREEAQALCSYIASVTNYENHCEHAGCYEPQVPGTSFCRFHRADILIEGDDLVGMGGVLRG
jgi:hypothetical protein